jgi:ribonuclease HII
MQSYKDLPLLQNYSTIIGIDEVGRGCWAGPVLVGAYVLSLDTVYIDGVTDSKAISAKKRLSLSGLLKNQSRYILKIAEPARIDVRGVGYAVTSLMQEIIEEVNSIYDDCLIVVDGQFASKFTKNTIKETKADYNYYTVGAASIIAKVERDRIMDEYHTKYPSYNFCKNKGYGTADHRKAIAEYGVIDLHRRSYKPIHEALKNVR